MAVTCFSAIRLRRSDAHLARPFMAALPALYAGAFVAILLLLLMVLPDSPGQLGTLEMLILAVWISIGALGYAWRSHAQPLSSDEQDSMVLGQQ